MSISKEERLAELQQERAALEERLRQILSKAGLPLEQVLGIIKKLEDVEESIKIEEEATREILACLDLSIRGR